MGFVYCLHDYQNKMCRIGKTKASDTNRIKSQTGYYPFDLKVTKVYFLDHDSAERYFHIYFKSKKVRADWYRITPDDFEIEVDRYKLKIGQPIVAKPVGFEVNGSIKYWRIVSDGAEYKCDFVHINFHSKLLKLRCKGHLININLGGDYSYYNAKNGNLEKGLAERANKMKFIHVYFN